MAEEKLENTAEEAVEETKESKKESKKEKKEKKESKITEAKLEVIIAIFLAVTALLTAWAAWIGSLHGGNQATNYAKSNNMAADGNSRYNEAAQTMMQDMLLWNEIGDLQLEYQYAVSSRDNDNAALIAYKLFYKCYENLSDSMAAAIDFSFEDADNYDDPVDYIDEWLEQPNAMTTPFSDEEYCSAYFDDALSVLAESEAILEEGMQDNTNGDSYNLATVIYSLVLFLLGIAGTFKNLPNRKIIVAISIVCFVVATVYMFTIPMPTGFNITNFFKH